MNSRVALILPLMLALAPPVSAASLTLLPEWFGNESLRTLWMLPDGKTLAGIDGDSVFRWSASEGRTNLGTLPSKIESNPVDIAAISDDGSTIIGKFGSNGFFWTTSNGMVLFPPLFSPRNYFFVTFPTALSRDGSVIVGNAHDPFALHDSHAFRWTAETGLVFLEGLEYAKATSSDGSVVVGSGALGDTDIFGQHDHQAARWTQTTGNLGLGVMANSWQQASTAGFVSADGSVVVGYGFPPDARIGPKVFRWTETDGMRPLSTLGDSQEPTAISADGNVIVGSMSTLIRDAGTFATTDDYFVWTPNAGLRKLHELLSSLGLDDLEPFNDASQSSALYDISADGRIILGHSADSVRRQHWLLDISPVPEPSMNLALLALWATMFSRRRVA